MKKAVLIVDDSEVDRYLLTRQLDDTGLVDRVFEARDGEEALAFFLEYETNSKDYPDEYPPLIVFLDVNMPKLNGFQFLEGFEKLRAKYDLSAVVVMMFSTSSSQEDKDLASNYEYVKDYLVKGDFSSEKLASRIKAYLS